MSDEARCENCGQIAPVPHFHWDATGRVYSCQRQSDEARALAGDILHSLCGYDCAADGVSEDEYNTDIETLAAALQREREGAGRDGERLDAVENGRWDVEWWPEGRGDKPAHWLVMPNIEDFKIIGSGLTVREAIDNAIQGDAAMQGEGGGP